MRQHFSATLPAEMGCRVVQAGVAVGLLAVVGLDFRPHRSVALRPGSHAQLA